MIAEQQRTSDEYNEFGTLMRLGNIAYTEGNRKQAHQMWRRAAFLRPSDEDVWVALLKVLETDEDRHVCLHNIVTINPQNEQAQKQYRAIAQETRPSASSLPTVTSRRLRRWLSWEYVWWAVEAVLIGLFIALGIILIAYIRI